MTRVTRVGIVKIVTRPSLAQFNLDGPSLALVDPDCIISVLVF